MFGVAAGTKLDNHYKMTETDTDVDVPLEKQLVQTEYGNFHVYIQGSLDSNRDGVVVLTVHDIGSNHKPLVRFVSGSSMQNMTMRVCYLHVCLPGQDVNAADFGADFPSMYELSLGLGTILDTVRVNKVIGLGIGAGANILCRLAMKQPRRVHGLVAIQPTASAATVMEKLKERLVALKLGSHHSPDTDQFIVYHKFGNLVEEAEDKMVAVEEFKKRLHTDINPKNLKLFVEAYMKRTEIIDQLKEKLSCDVLIVVGSKSSFVKQTEEIHRQSNLESTSFLKLENVGDVMIESPEKVAEAILYFCQGLGLLPVVPGPRSRPGSESGSRKTSMSEADVPNIRRLSLSPTDAE